MQSYETIVSRNPFYHEWTSTVTSDHGKILSATYVDEIPIPSSVTRVYSPTTGYYKREMPSSGSWSKTKSSGVIKMTPARIVNTTTKNYLGRVHRQSFNAWLQGQADPDDDCNIFVNDKRIIRGTASWEMQGDLSFWMDEFPAAPFYRVRIPDISRQTARAVGQCWSNLLQSYDLGTDLAELKQTLELVTNLLRSVTHPLRTFKNFVQGLTKRRGREGLIEHADDITSAWLQVRYGILPAYYSLKDIHDTLKDKSLYTTKRTRVKAEVTSAPVFSSPDEIYFYQVAHGSITANVTCKAHWETLMGKLEDLVSMNIAVTAWEIVPFSFVVDWFINAGDVITTYAKGLMNHSDQMIGCVSTKQTYQVLTYLHYPVKDYRSFTLGPSKSGVCPNITYYPATIVEGGSDHMEDVLLVEETVDNYDRVVIQPTDTDLALAPYLDWKRAIDGVSLSFQLNKRALRRLL